MKKQLKKQKENTILDKKKATEPKNKAEQAKQRTEQAKTNKQTQQLQRQYDNNFQRQMNSLNQTTAEDYMNPPLTKVNEFGEIQQTPTVVATPRKVNNTYSKGPFGNSGIIGTPSYSGNNYTGDRYNLKPAGFSNTQQQAYVRKYAEQIRGQYKPSRTMNQGVINTRQTHTPSRASMQRSPQHENTPNVGLAQAQRTQKKQQASNQQRIAQNIVSTQMPQKREVPVREQTGANRIVNIDSSNGLFPNTRQDKSSSDLRPVDILKPDGAKGRKAKYTAYNIPNEARHLSDTDNKTLSTYTGSGRTMTQQYSLMNKDRMNGFASFDNPREWNYIYGVYDAGKVKTSSRVVTQTR